MICALSGFRMIWSGANGVSYLECVSNPQKRATNCYVGLNANGINKLYPRDIANAACSQLIRGQIGLSLAVIANNVRPGQWYVLNLPGHVHFFYFTRWHTCAHAHGAVHFRPSGDASGKSWTRILMIRLISSPIYCFLVHRASFA